MEKSLGYIIEALPALLQGALVTLQLTALSVMLGLAGGILLGMARLSPLAPLRLATRAYIDFFRGTPLLVHVADIDIPISERFFLLNLFQDVEAEAWARGTSRFRPPDCGSRARGGASPSGSRRSLRVGREGRGGRSS